METTGSERPPLRVGIVGAGVVALRHIAAYAANPHCRIVAIAETDSARGQAVARQCGAALYTDYHELFREADVDAVSVCVPHHLHLDVALAATEARAHMLMEKPISNTLDEAGRIIEAADRADIKLMLGFVHRFRDEHLEAKRLIAEGAIGRPSNALDSICTRGGAHPPAWVWRKDMAGGGVLMYGGIHSIDRLRWFLDSEVRDVYARALRYSNEADVEDGLSAVLQFESGALGTLFENSPSYGNPGGWLTEVYGSDGAVRVKNGEWLELTRPGKQELRPVEAYDHFQREIDEFVASILENREPWITGEDGRRALAVAQAIYQSAERGEPVAVD